MRTLCFILTLLTAIPALAADDRPNILWLTCEDICPNLGCYGDDYAHTPVLDGLAAQGVRYMNAYGITGVCSPNRSCLITGVYPSSLGSHGMRSTTRLPDSIKCFPEYLRAAGYYCTNNKKTDYNFPTPKTAWNESSKKAHWRNRKKGQPFFSVFNFMVSHESQIRVPEERYQKNTARLTPDQRHDPAKAPIPPFHPDTPESRKDWARYHDNITAMDYQAGDILKQLEEDGLADNTIVFFFSDHGAGMPGVKKWVWEMGLKVPFIVRFPEKYKDWAPGAPGAHDGSARQLRRFSCHRPQPGRRRYPQAYARLGFPWPGRGRAARAGLRNSRPHGRAVRHGPRRSRHEVPVPPQFHPPPALVPVHQLHRRDADHAGLAPTA